MLLLWLPNSLFKSVACDLLLLWGGASLCTIFTTWKLWPTLLQWLQGKLRRGLEFYSVPKETWPFNVWGSWLMDTLLHFPQMLFLSTTKSCLGVLTVIFFSTITGLCRDKCLASNLNKWPKLNQDCISKHKTIFNHVINGCYFSFLQNCCISSVTHSLLFPKPPCFSTFSFSSFHIMKGKHCHSPWVHPAEGTQWCWYKQVQIQTEKLSNPVTFYRNLNKVIIARK